MAGSIRISANREALIGFLKTSGMGLIPQVFSNDFTPDGGVRQHLDPLEEQIEEHLDHHPLFIKAKQLRCPDA